MHIICRYEYRHRTTYLRMYEYTHVHTYIRTHNFLSTVTCGISETGSSKTSFKSSVLRISITMLYTNLIDQVYPIYPNPSLSDTRMYVHMYVRGSYDKEYVHICQTTLYIDHGTSLIRHRYNPTFCLTRPSYEVQSPYKVWKESLRQPPTQTLSSSPAECWTREV